MDPANNVPPANVPPSSEPPMDPDPQPNQEPVSAPPSPMAAMEPDPLAPVSNPVYSQPQEPIAPPPSPPVMPQSIPPQPIIETATPPMGAQSVITGGQEKKGISKFALFVGISIVVLAGVWAVVAYLYFDNKDVNTSENEPGVVEEVSSVPAFDPSEIQISNGDITRLSATGEAQQLVRKEDYPGTGIIGFARVMVSPDNTKLCFESIPPATDPTIYVANVDGTEVEEIAKNKHTCSWSTDSNHVLYVNDPLGEKAVNVYAYSLTSKEERNLTENTNTAADIRQYSITDVSENIILCTYDTVSTTGSKLSTTNCQIDLTTGEVTERVEEPEVIAE